MFCLWKTEDGNIGHAPKLPKTRKVVLKYLSTVNMTFKNAYLWLLRREYLISERLHCACTVLVDAPRRLVELQLEFAEAPPIFILSSKSANSDFPFTLYVLARHYTTGGTRPPFFPLGEYGPLVFFCVCANALSGPISILCRTTFIGGECQKMKNYVILLPPTPQPPPPPPGASVSLSQTHPCTHPRTRTHIS